ncbi:MAG: 50S ribosomal protein L22 [Eubacteriales bacterium]|nr:50S ribosomal protein L22 [Eubacteriales bacterium]
MKTKVYSKQELQERREEILAAYRAPHKKNKKLRVLTKKERKELGIGKDCGKASIKYVRIAPSKVNIVAKLIRGKDLREAKAILQYTPKAAAPVLLKLLNSAAANAVNNNELNEDALFVSELTIGPGPTMKRWLPRGKGSATPILKRSSRIWVVLREREEGDK